MGTLTVKKVDNTEIILFLFVSFNMDDSQLMRDSSKLYIVCEIWTSNGQDCLTLIDIEHYKS